MPSHFPILNPMRISKSSEKIFSSANSWGHVHYSNKLLTKNKTQNKKLNH